MSELSIGDFEAYFKAIYKRDAFPWQTRLLGRVAGGKGWPELLDLPTGTGKTAAIDVALFHLALDAAQPAAQRTAPTRIVMVVDRRTVVDQAFEHAKKIARELATAKRGVLRVVADRLRSLSGDPNAWPLALAQLRGGMPRDDAWARRPDQALVAVSTVDQVGSRLLFRGYGVSEAMRPIHAGLLANDTLLLLDEVHLSEPFRQTLDALRRYREWGSAGLPTRWHVVALSATPGSKGGFELDAEDYANEDLARRLAANKPATLAEPVKISGNEAAKRATLAAACVEQALTLAAPGRAVGVIVNRVATAQEVFAQARKEIGKALPTDACVKLVTGRMRPIDRDDLDRELRELVGSNRARGAKAPPIVVVSTQCIEAGADYDFDALVTECASLDALRQRFGRLNRLGKISDAAGVVLVRSDSLAKDARDPIYDAALAKTWAWLNSIAVRSLVAFGINAMEGSLAELRVTGADGEGGLAELLASKNEAPVMLPGHLDAWVQTKPVPVPDPQVALWLHGIKEPQAPEVQIVWRADLGERLFEMAAEERGEHRELATEALVRRLEVCPPVGLEAITVPQYAARAWLAKAEPAELADVEGRSLDDDEKGDRRDRRARSAGRAALLWQGDGSRMIRASDLENGLPPGSTLVVPSSYGGVAEANWNPASLAAVEDLGGRARWLQTRRPVLRLHPSLMAAGQTAPVPSEGDDPEGEDREAVTAWLDAERSGPAKGWLAEALAAFPVKGKHPQVVRIEATTIQEGDGSEREVEPGYLAIVARARVKGDEVDAAPGDATTEGDDGSYSGVKITLTQHMQGVASWARGFSKRCGLPDGIAHDVELAARWHDAGKVDRRFQRMLHGGSESRALSAPEPLAKSEIAVENRAARQAAQKRSGYPLRTRHELASVALLAAHGSLLDEARDRDLVLHLVASHHGFCRPFAPVAEADSDPVELTLGAAGKTVSVSSDHRLAQLDSGVAERFWRLIERYGWFGLAWLEAILRLADHRRSEQERDGGDVSEAKEES